MWYYQGPPVMAPPQYAAAPTPGKTSRFLERWLVYLHLSYLYQNTLIWKEIRKRKIIDLSLHAFMVDIWICWFDCSVSLLCFCCLLDGCCNDPSAILVFWSCSPWNCLLLPFSFCSASELWSLLLMMNYKEYTRYCVREGGHVEIVA